MVQRTATSAGAVILREIDGTLKIALAQHARATAIWALPKGHVEAGESLEQAALREIYEETGLDNVQLILYLGAFTRESVRSNGEIELKTIHFYLAYSPANSQSQAPTDARFTDVGWFSPAEALQLIEREQDQAFLRERLGVLFG